MSDPLHLDPPDDTGSETLRRYRYQASLVVPFCLNCACSGDVVSVIVEHFEDFVVEHSDLWHFVQVKTRDAGYGPWKLRTAMGGLRSLLRTYRTTTHLKARYSLFLEGAIAHDDPLNKLVPPRSTLDDELREKVMEGLDVADSECDPFLSSTSVRPTWL